MSRMLPFPISPVKPIRPIRPVSPIRRLQIGRHVKRGLARPRPPVTIPPIPTTAEIMAAYRSRGFRLACPWCGGQDAIAIEVLDMKSCTCGDCGDSFAVSTAISKLRSRLAEWERLEALLALGERAAES